MKRDGREPGRPPRTQSTCGPVGAVLVANPLLRTDGSVRVLMGAALVVAISVTVDLWQVIVGSSVAEPRLSEVATSAFGATA